MPELPVDVSEIHKLLLDPTAENVLRVTGCLELLVGEVAKARRSIDAGGVDSHADRQFLLKVREETLRVRNLLDNAARFYSAMNAKTGSPAYGRHGLLYKIESPRRALARL
jgi:hypothetical protein